MAEVATIVRHSHERWDGSGYPDGLMGERIPLASRIILCADAFHAIRCDRPYRAGRSADEALTELRACAGTQFDPAVVAALARLADDARDTRGGGMALPRNKRLVVLLTALAITGTAVAAVPELRNAVRSVFGATSSDPARDFSGEPGRGFSLGPLGDLLSMAPNANALLTRGVSGRLQDAGPAGQLRTPGVVVPTPNGDSGPGAPTPNGDSGPGAPTPNGDSGPGAPTPNGDSGPGAPTPNGDSGPGAPTPNGDSGPGAPTPNGDSGPGAPTPNGDSGPGAPTPNGDSGPGAPTPNPDNSVGTEQASPNPGKADKPAGPGEYCRGESKHEARDQPHSDFAECVQVQAH